MQALVMQVLNLLDKINVDNKYVIFDEVNHIIKDHEEYFSFKSTYHMLDLTDFYSFAYIDENGKLQQRIGLV